MPFYCYRLDDGEVRDELFRMGEAPPKVQFLDGRTGVRDRPSEWQRGAKPAAKWPKECMSMSVIPQQVMDARRDAARRGVPLTFTDTGKAIAANAHDHAKAARMNGLHQRDSWGTSVEA